MNITDLLNILHTAEKLKDTTRHSYTSGGRHESVAEHTFRLALMAYFIKDEFPEADIDKVIKMCLIHDIGEAFTGDIPAFEKTVADEETEKRLLIDWVDNLPAPYNTEMISLYKEIETRQTLEAKLFKALDGLEAVIQHNEADLSTWSDNEYNVNLIYAEDKCDFSPYLKELRKSIKDESIQKIEQNLSNTELWDAYDENFNLIEGVTLKRGEKIDGGVFHLVCDIIVRHTEGDYLIMQRDARKHYGGMWEATAGGSALVGESPYQCAVRELYEETGIHADTLTEVGRVVDNECHSAYVEYLCVTNCDKDSVKLQDGETSDYRWVDKDTLLNMKNDELITQRMQCFIDELK